MSDWINDHFNWWTTSLAVAAIMAIGWVIAIAILDDMERK